MNFIIGLILAMPIGYFLGGWLSRKIGYGFKAFLFILILIAIMMFFQTKSGTPLWKLIENIVIVN